MSTKKPENQSEPLISTETKIETLEIENPPDYDSVRYSKISEEKAIVYPAGCISSLLFSWMYRTLKQAKKSKLLLSNLGNISSKYRAKEFLNELKPKWYGKFQFCKRAPLFRAILTANLSRVLLIIFFSSVLSVFEICSVYIFRQILVYFQDGSQPILPLKYLIGIMLLMKFFIIFLNRNIDFAIAKISSKTSIQLNSLIYDKLLKTATYNKKNFSEAELINFIQIDSEKFGDFLSESTYTLVLPMQLGFYIYYLFIYFGPSFLFGFGALVIIMIIITNLQKRKMKLQKEMMKAQDARMKVTTQAFNIIKTIKLYSWENLFIEKIREKRNKELEIMKRMNNISLLYNGFYWSTSAFISMVNIFFHTLFSRNMNTADIMTSIYIFNNLNEPLNKLPSFFDGLLDSLISLKRIQKFLFTKDHDTEQVEILPPQSPLSVSIHDCSFGLDIGEETETLLLKNINLDINKGDFIGIVGEVGSGKTCLLNALLNNLGVKSKNPTGNIKLSGNISYVSQNPWILNDTVRNNILFFKEMDEKKYLKIIEICELTQDIKLFSGGDMTEIGEKGVGLSGGQKARLAIARALYSDSDIYLFDDPLSALDAYVGMRIFNQAFLGYLGNKTRIISTHALQYISYMSKVIYMKEGMIDWFGTSNDLVSQPFYQEFTKTIENKKKDHNKLQKMDTKEEKNESILANVDVVRITKDEKTKKGAVKLKVWIKFLIYIGGVSYVLMVFFVNILWKSFEIASDYFLSYWSSQTDLPKRTVYRNLIIYVTLCMSVSVVVFIRSYFMFKGYLAFNIKMHDELLTKLMHAPVNLFHDTIPRGQIINRMGKDLQSSTRLNNVSTGTLRVLFQLIGCIAICGMFNIYSLLIIPFIGLIELMVGRFYIHGGRDLNRLEGACRSPIINVFSETIPGLPVIRAYSFEENFTNKFQGRLNDYFKIKLFQSGGSGWFGIRLDFISYILLLFVLLFALIFEKNLSNESMGLLLSYSIKLIDYLYSIMERVNLLEQLFTSVERCFQFTKVQQEAEALTALDNSIGDFPKFGAIRFDRFNVRYRPETPLVLKNISFSISAGEKVGVVGRTGSGKSTLCLCLFRILEADSGRILIDDIDISQIGLEHLRETLTVIPQEPTLIEGTLRENIDPKNEHSDREIKDALIQIGLGYLIESKPLTYEIKENGSNLSIGEKQLLCIARAILRKSKIILMDEATSSIDYKTETLIQNCIGTVLKSSTVITIAHRIKTIINYDKILVLANGEIMEYDTPKNLLKNTYGLFNELYKESAL